MQYKETELEKLISGETWGLCTMMSFGMGMDVPDILLVIQCSALVKLFGTDNLLALLSCLQRRIILMMKELQRLLERQSGDAAYSWSNTQCGGSMMADIDLNDVSVPANAPGTSQSRGGEELLEALVKGDLERSSQSAYVGKQQKRDLDTGIDFLITLQAFHNFSSENMLKKWREEILFYFG
ncbi:hypothetical protein EDD16DRAFT_1527082 [Pisolithus croceorrhizus]|nr:hypothetical protein EDD16DRAFT_1527082 [Pisolithus croceorrhizus]